MPIAHTNLNANLRTRSLRTRALGTLIAALLPAHSQAKLPDLKDYKIQCADEKNCSPAVGALFHPAGSCTSFLIEPNVVATNAHCVPPGLKTDDSCADLVTFLYPAAGAFKREQMTCDHLLSISSPSTDAWVKVPDYAFFKLRAASDRPPLKVNHEGVADNQPLTIRKVNFKGAQTAEIEVVECKAVQNSVYDALFSADTSPVVALGACPVIPGNSGSPMIDAGGEVRAIVSAREVRSLNHRDGARPIVRGFGANFACITLFFTGVGFGLSKECINVTGQVNEAQALHALYQKTAEASTAKFDARIKEVYKSLVEPVLRFDWAFRALPKSTEGSEDAEVPQATRQAFQPRCWLPNFRPAKKGDGDKFTTSALWLDVSADDDGRLVSQVMEEPLTLNFKLNSRKGELGNFAMDTVRSDGEKRHSEMSLESCK